MGGMGRAVCTRLRNDGYNVIGLDRATNEEMGEGCFSVDLCSEEELARTFGEIKEKYGEISFVKEQGG